MHTIIHSSLTSTFAIFLHLYLLLLLLTSPSSATLSLGGDKGDTCMWNGQEMCAIENVEGIHRFGIESTSYFKVYIDEQDVVTAFRSADEKTRDCWLKGYRRYEGAKGDLYFTRLNSLLKVEAAQPNPGTAAEKLAKAMSHVGLSDKCKAAAPPEQPQQPSIQTELEHLQRQVSYSNVKLLWTICTTYSELSVDEKYSDQTELNTRFNTYWVEIMSLADHYKGMSRAVPRDEKALVWNVWLGVMLERTFFIQPWAVWLSAMFRHEDYTGLPDYVFECTPFLELAHSMPMPTSEQQQEERSRARHQRHREGSLATESPEDEGYRQPEVNFDGGGSTATHHRRHSGGGGGGRGGQPPTVITASSYTRSAYRADDLSSYVSSTANSQHQQSQLGTVPSAHRYSMRDPPPPPMNYSNTVRSARRPSAAYAGQAPPIPSIVERAYSSSRPAGLTPTRYAPVPPPRGGQSNSQGGYSLLLLF